MAHTYMIINDIFWDTFGTLESQVQILSLRPLKLLMIFSPQSFWGPGSTSLWGPIGVQVRVHQTGSSPLLDVLRPRARSSFTGRTEASSVARAV
jgi:hypothetical protein